MEDCNCRSVTGDPACNAISPREVRVVRSIGPVANGSDYVASLGTGRCQNLSSGCSRKQWREFDRQTHQNC